MTIDHPGFSFIAGAVCLDFVQSIRFRGWAKEFDTITDFGALLDWTEAAKTLKTTEVRRLRRVAKAKPGRAQRSLQRALHLRDVLFEVLTGVASGENVSGRQLARLNDFLRAAGAKRIVSRSEGQYGWSWDCGDDLDAPLWPVSQSAAELLASDRLKLVRQCDADVCLRMFVDGSRNRGRRWCSTGCGNRHRVREHYWRSRG